MDTHTRNCKHPDDCQRPAKSGAWCRMHRMRIYVHGDPGPVESTRQSREGSCIHPGGCDRPKQARGWCAMHYSRVRKNGEPGPAESVKVLPERCQHPSGECDREPHAKKLCKLHYERVRRGEDIGPAKSQRELYRKTCLHPDGCERDPVARGWCSMHYQRVMKSGDPGPVTVKSARWRPNSSGYLAMSYRDDDGVKRTVLQHRVIMESVLGRQLHPGETVHHINGDRADNRVENLQVRRGRHGKGAVYECLDCGSANVRSVELQ